MTAWQMLNPAKKIWKADPPKSPAASPAPRPGKRCGAGPHRTGQRRKSRRGSPDPPCRGAEKPALARCRRYGRRPRRDPKTAPHPASRTGCRRQKPRCFSKELAAAQSAAQTLAEQAGDTASRPDPAAQQQALTALQAERKNLRDQNQAALHRLDTNRDALTNLKKPSPPQNLPAPTPPCWIT